MHPRALVPAFGLLLAALIATSSPQRVGDAHEYLAMAMNMARFRAPALAPADLARIDSELGRWHFRGVALTTHQELRDAEGHQGFFHFWFYSALAVPGVWVANAVGAHPNDAFVALNSLLFLAALWVVSKRLVWWLAAPLFCSPVLWWIDKSHTEVFTFSLLALAFALLREAPWWSMVALGAASSQNPPIAAVLLCVGAVTLVVRSGAKRDPRFWIGATVAAAIALAHPIYYGWRWGLATPQLIKGTLARWPTVQEWGAVLWDPNLGLAFSAPLLVCTIVAAALAVAVVTRLRCADSGTWLALTAAVVFLLSFAQSTNINSGATPGMSRYGVWLIPLAIPILQQAGVVVPARRLRWLAPVALASCLWCAVAFQPRLPERSGTPSRTASVIWARWPSADNPLTEVFAERLSYAEPGLAPIATPGCTKVLLIDGKWPVPCRPEPAPRWCAAAGALCYANRDGPGYRFVRAAYPAGSGFERRRTWVWDVSFTTGIDRILRHVDWPTMRLAAPGEPGAMLRYAENVSWTYGIENGQDLLVYVRQPRGGATLTLALPGSMTGALFDAETGEQIEALRIEARPREQATVVIPRRMAVAVVLNSRR
jgi:hypothetical protein